ncbi:MAG: ABC transporter permease, partial [Planctomycetes bacterium]|nr:ABC transporter permease [Planctomycetota bacterium]
MRTYIIKRILLIIPTLFIITVMSYGMMRLAPGDPMQASQGNLLGGGAEMREGESKAAEAFKKYYNLDKPWYVGY